MARFTDKVVIVTGSSTGIGKAAILAFAAEGASVVLHGSNAGRLADAKASLLEAGIPESRILAIQGELNNDATHDKLINETIARFGKIDVLVNNAASFKKPGDDVPVYDNFDYVFTVNVRAVFRLVELATPHLEKTKGNIINVSSIVSYTKTVERAKESLIYAMSKAALDRYTKNVNQSLMKKGIRINNINPGPFDSNFGKRGAGSSQASASVGNPEHEKLFKKVTPVGRFGRPDELVPVFLLLADENSSFITGSLWTVDGGMSGWAPEATDLNL